MALAGVGKLSDVGSFDNEVDWNDSLTIPGNQAEFTTSIEVYIYSMLQMNSPCLQLVTPS
jgi:hypothetical protein